MVLRGKASIQVMGPAAKVAFTNASKHEMMWYGGFRGEWPPGNAINDYFSEHYRVLLYAHVKEPEIDGLISKAQASFDQTEEEARLLHMPADMIAITKQYRVNLLPKVNYLVYHPWLKGYQGESAQWL